ncbi:MAG TPA: Wzz/FepE/Etk N-terminal domain-containing protein, partial [Bacteroidia bacterium]|nr:Wzz/FepE/Etk N-terminal domain-containing protein [Bacteroidia bacterium]
MEKLSKSQQLLQLFKRQRVLIMCTTLVALVVTGIYIYVTPPCYQSEAIIQYKDQNQNTIQLNLPGTTTNSNTEKIKSAPFIIDALSKNNNLISYYTTKDYKKTENKYAFPYQIEYQILNSN